MALAPRRRMPVLAESLFQIPTEFLGVLSEPIRALAQLLGALLVVFTRCLLMLAAHHRTHGGDRRLDDPHAQQKPDLQILDHRLCLLVGAVPASVFAVA